MEKNSGRYIDNYNIWTRYRGRKKREGGLAATYGLCSLAIYDIMSAKEKGMGGM